MVKLRPQGVIRPQWRRFGIGAAAVAAATPRPSTASAPARSDLGGTGAPQGVLAFVFGYQNLAASLAAVMLYRAIPGAASTFAQIGVQQLYRGSILGMTLSATGAATSGAATFEVYVEGTPTGAKLIWTAGARARMPFKAGTYGFQAAQSLDVRVTTTSDWAPTTTDVELHLITSFIPE